MNENGNGVLVNPTVNEGEGIFPSPVFEGSEKRLIVTFERSEDADMVVNYRENGLRSLARDVLDTMLELAECQIVSHRSNEYLDAYVLSESSLFVYRDMLMLKTCGTTKLLSCVPFMLKMARDVGMEPTRVKYSRASFLFPESQPAPYHRFEHECDHLKELFSFLGKSSAYVLGDSLAGMQWHVFVAGKGCVKSSVKTLEVCMTGLSPQKAAQFFRDESFISSQFTTAKSGISGIVPTHTVDDYVFEPCGYSMNGTCEGEFSTIHITPEESFSYASFEVCGSSFEPGAASDYIAKTISAFKPQFIAIAMSADTQEDNVAPASLACPSGYEFHCASYQEDSCGGDVAFFTMAQKRDCAVVGTDWSREKEELHAQESPRAVLKHIPSFKTVSFSDYMATSSDNSSDCGLAPSQHFQDHCRAKPVEVVTFEDVVTSAGATPLPNTTPQTLDAFARTLIDDHGLEDNFYIVDLGVVRRLYHAWQEAMPRVHPHYAVKCNNDTALLRVLASLGAGFDCASQAEVEQVMALGVSADRIIFANPCKRPSDIRCAAARSITHSTFDTESELIKLDRFAPGSRVLLRIRADDPSARCPLGNKFGAEEWEWEELFTAAQRHNIPVDGVSFHVGSGATDPQAFTFAIELARKAFDMGESYGFDMKVLDIGGGFCGGKFGSNGKVDLEGVPAAVNMALTEHFPEISGVKVIAEPGRFFSESIATLGTLVYGRRSRPHTFEDNSPVDFDYWITDGLYGSMNCLLYDHATLAPRALLSDGKKDRLVRSSTVFGPTCDGLDTVLRDYPLPELEVGEWLLFPGMGAYTLCGASKFNGINAVDVPTFYVCSTEP